MRTESAKNRRPIAVLLVDDQRFVSLALERLLATEQDIELHWCGRAADGIAQANQINPMLILQDLVLPEIDGLTMVRLFRANPQTAQTPVIILSGNDDASARDRALADGANDYLVKLPAKSDLVACIRRHAGGAGEINTGEDLASSVKTPDESILCADKTFDRSVLAVFEQAGTPGSQDFTLMLIDQFIEEAASQVDKLRDARQRHDVPVLKATAHSLKGSSMTMGARRLAALCVRMEEQMARNPDNVGPSELMTEVDREFVKVQHALAAERKGIQQ
jgi:DNA-binding response OmpR family regulator